MTAVLITGATGQVGSRLVAEYLTAGQHVLALARGEDAEDRVHAALDLWQVDPAHREHLKVLRGDVDQPDLGLQPSQLELVRREARQLIHAACSTRLDLTHAQAAESILGGTQRALDLFSSLAHPERFGFISTLEVAGRSSSPIPEDFLDDAPHKQGRAGPAPTAFINNYGRYKRKAEALLQRRVRAGCPVTVFRPGMVVGEAATGRTLAFQSFYRLLDQLLRPGILPWGLPIETICVDVLTSGVRALMGDPAARGRVYNFTQGEADPLALPALLRRCRRLAGARLAPRLLVSPLAVTTVFRLSRPFLRGRIRRRAEIAAVFLPYFTLHWRFETRATRRALARHGVVWPTLSGELPNLLRYYMEKRSKNS